MKISLSTQSKKAIAKYAKKTGETASVAADKLIGTAVSRLEALNKYNRHPKKKTAKKGKARAAKAKPRAAKAKSRTPRKATRKAPPAESLNSQATAHES